MPTILCAKVHRFTGVRQIEVHAVEPLVLSHVVLQAHFWKNKRKN
jgi:hypothetical protein